MSKKIMLIYQDCPMCGSRSNWGKKQTEIADTHGLEIVKTPFYKTGVKGLISKAVESGMGRLPFFTDGERFSYSIEDFVEKPKPKRKATKKRKTSTKRKAIMQKVNDGADSEN